MKAQEIRDKFSTFFQKKGHEKIASSSLIPHNDNTLLFANAGMNQFKDYFTGNSIPKNRRAVTIQKCVRAGGKHNDLENVGFTARHHTFFEMLGNFSFGDYFKDEAIAFAWEFLTIELKIPAERLYITVHHSDDEALKIWNEKIGIPKEKIFKKGDKDNFWEMGDVGPCGPCSEIFYDHGEDHSTPGFVPGEGQDILDDELRYVEIWNLVFMQFEKSLEGTKSLPKPSIDTGAGLERITAVMQGKYWNYDTDLFDPIFKKLEEISGKKYIDEKYTTNMRVVADHIRSSVMLITDGVIPSNEGRGYVLRRIIRRAIRNLRELEIKEVSFHKLIPAVFESLGAEYPQNEKNISLAEKFLQMEEKKFLETLDQGLKFLNEAIEKDVVNNSLKGESAFKLYDTYGFPVDLTEVILAERKLKLDMDGFNKAMEQRKEESRKSWKGAVNVDDKVFHEACNKHGKTRFLGYTHTRHDAKLLQKIDAGELTALIFDQSPFYGESGGQAGDSGVIIEDDNIIATISDTLKPVDGLHVHFSNNADHLEEGRTYTLQVDEEKRKLIERNHSATHLLQSALIEVLGDHVKQAGSSVSYDRLRFDFTHTQAVTKDELKEVERLVNQAIKKELSVDDNIMTMDEAIKAGAMALFGEKYGDQVRVLTMGDFSTELCGGTHVHNTGDISFFSIISETSLSSGIRRIEAVSSTTALERLEKRSTLFEQLEQLTKVKGDKVVERINISQQELLEARKEIKQLKEKIQQLNSKDMFSKMEALTDNIQYTVVEAPSDSDLRKLSDLFSDQHPDGVLILYKKNKDQVSLLLRSPKKSAIDCSKLIKTHIQLLNGRGGGKQHMAQGSGDAKDLNKFITNVKNEMVETLC